MILKNDSATVPGSAIDRASLSDFHPELSPRSRGPARRGLDSILMPIPAGWLDLSENLVRYREGGEERLSRQETALLTHLVARANRCVSRAELLREVWHCNPEVVVTRTVDMHVAMLRKKLRDPAHDPDVILTVSGSGYLFRT